MATGQTLYSDISSLVNDIQEGALMTLRSFNLLTPTVSVFNDTSGMNPRKGYQWGSADVRLVGEGDDITPTKFSETTLATLTPVTARDMFFISDQREASDFNAIRGAAAMEMGNAFAEHIDTKIAANFSSLTGGTVGSGGGTLSMNDVRKAVALLRQAKVPGPLFCAVGEGQWYHMTTAGTVEDTFTRATAFQERVVENYYISSLLGGVVFVVTPNVSGAAGGTAYGAVYSPLAMAYDQRKAFNVRPERDESREGYELNASLWYATGVWDAARGVQLVGTDVIA